MGPGYMGKIYIFLFGFCYHLILYGIDNSTIAIIEIVFSNSLISDSAKWSVWKLDNLRNIKEI